MDKHNNKAASNNSNKAAITLPNGKIMLVQGDNTLHAATNALPMQAKSRKVDYIAATQANAKPDVAACAAFSNKRQFAAIFAMAWAALGIASPKDSPALRVAWAGFSARYIAQNNSNGRDYTMDFAWAGDLPYWRDATAGLQGAPKHQAWACKGLLGFTPAHGQYVAQAFVNAKLATDIAQVVSAMDKYMQAWHKAQQAAAKASKVA